MLLSRIALLIILAVSLQSVRAEVPEASGRLLNEGVQLFQQGDLAAARDRFEQAIEGGMSSPSLFYNLGVTCYQLGDFDAAADAFRRLLSGPDEALARYNLGLVALAQHDLHAARAWFDRAASEQAPNKVRALAQRQLERLDDGPESAPVAVGQQAYAAVSGGYDSNIAGLPDAGSTSEGGLFGDVLVAGQLEKQAGPRSYLTLDTAAYTRWHPANGDYDSGVFQARLGWTERGPGLERGGRLFADQSWFDSERFEQRLGLEGFYRRRICPLSELVENCHLRLAGAGVSGGPGFGAYDGQWYQVTLAAERQVGGWQIDGDYRLEVNRRRDVDTAEGFISVSPQRHQLALTGRFPVRPGLVMGGLGSYRYSHYPDAHRVPESVGDSGQRRDHRLEAGLLLERSLDSRWLVRAEWLVLRNLSSLSQYDYRRQTLMLTIETSLQR